MKLGFVKSTLWYLRVGNIDIRHSQYRCVIISHKGPLAVQNIYLSLMYSQYCVLCEALMAKDYTSILAMSNINGKSSLADVLVRQDQHRYLAFRDLGHASLSEYVNDQPESYIEIFNKF